MLWPVFALLLCTQKPAGLDESLDALARAAATFAATAPGLTAEETLDQRGRRGSVEILRGKKDRIKSLDFRLPGDFRTHRVVSRYALDNTGKGRVLHEIRTVVTMDGRPVTGSGEARHAMTIGLRSDDDRTKRRLLEDLDQEGLEGAVTDFGQLILLFTGRLQPDYEFTPGADREVEGEPVTVLRYRQLSGNQGLTFFKDRTEERENAAGEIWLRQKDLLPLRITMRTTEQLSKKFTIRTESAVDYGSSPFGLVPERVFHQQFVNSDLMMENDLHYAGFHNDRVPIP